MPFTVVGLYIEQICMAVLFFLKVSDSLVFLVEGILMVVLMVLTLSAQMLFRRSFQRKCDSTEPCIEMSRLIITFRSHHQLPPNVARHKADAGALGAGAQTTSRASGR